MKKRNAKGSILGTTHIKLTPAQHSALECHQGGGLPPLVESAWESGYLLVPEPGPESKQLLMALYGEIIELANGEDGHAIELRRIGEFTSARFARAASTALTNLATKVLQLAETHGAGAEDGTVTEVPK